MYEDCLKCKKLGAPCDGPNFLAMSTAELVEWCNTRRKQAGLTYDRIADETGLSKGTVSGFFGGGHADYRLETIRPILKLLVGGEWGDSPCADPTDNERASYEAKIEHLNGEISWRNDKIQHFTDNAAFLKEQLANERGTVKTLKKALISVSVALGISLLVIITALIVDRLNGDIGFFWLEGLFNPHGITETFQQWRT